MQTFPFLTASTPHLPRHPVRSVISSSRPSWPTHALIGSPSPSVHASVGSLFLLTSGDGDQLLGSLGDVVSALDDLLSEELVVHRGAPGLRGRRLTALHLQPRGTGSQQAEGAVDCIQRRALRRNEGNQNSDPRKIKRATPRQWEKKRDIKQKYRELTFGKSEAISVTAEWIFSEHGTKLKRREMCHLI